MAEEISGGDSAGKGVVPGTRQYLAPEDLNGASPSVTGDIYSVGVSMYELLVGRTAHERPTRPDISTACRPPQQLLDRLVLEDSLVDDVTRAQQEAQTDTRADLKVRPEWIEEEVDLAVLEERLVPASLIAVVETATARNPAHRYSTAVSMREGLEYFVHEHALPT
jgi:serine/threonine protein kinase